MPRPVEDETPPETIQALPVAATSILSSPTMRRANSEDDSLPMSQSESSLPYRKSRSNAASLYASTLSPHASRPESPVGRSSPSRVLAGTVFDSGTNRPLPDSPGDSPGEPLNLIVKAFVPHVSIYTSQDTEALIQEKGFQNGLWELLRPFGERIQGKVTIRDSNGLSRPVDDFSVRFTRIGEDIVHPDPILPSLKNAQPAQGQNGEQDGSSRDQTLLADVEKVVERHLTYAEESFRAMPLHGALMKQGLDVETASPYYALYLRRLLSGMPIVPHETFAHPVACVIAISSRTQDPIGALRNLYHETREGEKKLPVWVDGDYLRYYVLVHDEENDDITRSMGLFEQMKRHLGLHCHLLRLRSSQSAETDDDSIPLPRSEWMTAAEELADIQRSEDNDDFQDTTRYIFESDATAIRTFIREMVTQSIVPTMERHISLWNDQVASRRRGITGRFMSLSRKWAFGGGSRTSTGAGSSSKDSYDSLGFYRAENPEAIMRKMADFAFMLRDWKLAQSTYDLIRTDFSDAKAWKYHAAANEMAAVSLLMLPQQLTSKTRAETIDQMLESAFYSYNTRCNAPYGAMRSLTLSLELLRLRGGTNIDDAGRWGLRLLESKILGPVGDALIRERLAICYASKPEIGSWNWGGRRRKSAAWSVLAAEAWAQQSKYLPAQRCLNEAERMYTSLPHRQGIAPFGLANEYMTSLRHKLVENLEVPDEDGDGEEKDANGHIDEESEALTDLRSRRISTVVRTGVLETAPLHGEEAEKGDDTTDGAIQKEFG